MLHRLVSTLALLVAPLPILPAAEEGFAPLFNGRDLTGWSGDPLFWSVQDEAITARSTTDQPAKANTFLIWEGEVANFELRAQFRLTGESANSGIQYRSRVLDAATWSVGGYQADMDFANRYTGMFYEEKGRGILVRPGKRFRIGTKDTEGRPALTALGSVTDAAALKAAIRVGDWNEIVIIADGNHLRHYVNGLLTAEAIDDDPAHAAASGVLALQLHTGPPMTVAFRNVRLKTLP